MILLTDANDRQIMPGDVVRVFHFIDARRKRHYMYKIVHEIEGHLYGAHACGIYKKGLTLDNSYSLPRESQKLEEYEIVAGFNGGSFDERPRTKPTTRGES